MIAKIISLFPISSCGPSRGFDLWFSSYPRRVAKAESLKAYTQQLLNGFSPEDMLNGAVRFAEMCKRTGVERNFIPHPATWLRGERWQDEELLEYIPATPEQIAVATDKADQLMRRGKYAIKYE